MRREVKHIEIDDIKACVYKLVDTSWGVAGCVEVHVLSSNPTESYISACRRILKYLHEEGFVTTEAVKVISLPHPA